MDSLFLSPQPGNTDAEPFVAGTPILTAVHFWQLADVRPEIDPRPIQHLKGKRDRRYAYAGFHLFGGGAELFKEAGIFGENMGPHVMGR